MSVLIILAMVMFEILGRANQAWSGMRANTRIYENSRVAFDLITRDLHNTVVSNETGREIPFYVGTDSPSGSGGHIDRVMVAAIGATSRMGTAESRLSEISYTYDNYILRRRLVQNHHATWNFYGDVTTDWVGHGGGGFQQVIHGVERLQFDFFTAEGEFISHKNSLPGSSLKDFPSHVLVSITLFDPRAMELKGTAQEQMIERTRRTFSKMVYLKTQGF